MGKSVCAVFTANNKEDRILVDNEECLLLPVDKEVMTEFLKPDRDWSSFKGESWDKFAADILHSAPRLGKIVAFWLANELHIMDNKVWQQKVAKYSAKGGA